MADKLENAFIHCGALLRKHILLMQSVRKELADKSPNYSDASCDLFSQSAEETSTENVEPRYGTLMGAVDPYAPLIQLWNCWKTKLAPLVCSSKNEQLKIKYYKLIRIVAALWIMNGEPLIALEAYGSIASLYPSDVTIWLRAINLCSRLNLWQLAKDITDKLHHKLPENSNAAHQSCPDFLKLHLLWAQLHLAHTAGKSCSSILDELNQLSLTYSDAAKSFPTYRFRAFLAEIRSHAGRLPNAELDPLVEATESLSKWNTVLKSHFKQLDEADSAPIDFAEKATSDSMAFGQIVTDMSNYFDACLRVSLSYVSSGLPREAYAYLQEGLKVADKLGHVTWRLKLLTQIANVKSKMGEEKCSEMHRNLLGNLGGAQEAKLQTETVPGLLQEDRPSQPDTSVRSSDRLRSKANNSTCSSISVVEDSFDVPPKSRYRSKKACQISSISSLDSEDSNVFEAPKLQPSSLCHQPDCPCWLCKYCQLSSVANGDRCSAQVTLMSLSTNEQLTTEQRQMMWTLLSTSRDTLLTSLAQTVETVCKGFGVRNCFQFTFASPLLYSLSNHLLDWSESQAPLPERLQWAERAIKLYQNEPLLTLEQLLPLKLCTYMAKFSVIGGLKLDADWLKPHLSEQMNQLSLKSKRKAPSGAKQVKQWTALVDQIKQDFENHRHLLLYPWRRRICELLAAVFWKSDPTSAAWYLNECESVSVRQRSRLLPYEQKRVETNSLVPEFTSSRQFLLATDEMPHDWTLIHLHISTLPERILWLTRIRAHCPPLVVPLCSLSAENLNLLDQFEALQKQSELSLNETKFFWERRFELENSLKALTVQLQSELLGVFSPLLLGRSTSQMTEPSWLQCCQKLRLIGWSESRIEILQTAALELSDSQIEEFIKCLGNPEWRMETLRVLKQFALAAAFNKDTVERDPVILILSQELLPLCWECLPIFDSNHQNAICRVPNLHYCIGCLRQQRMVPMRVDGSNAFYILNPNNDLANTQKTLEELFKKQSDWNGLVGFKPAPHEITEALEKKELYCGHGSGMRYTNSSAVRHANCNAVAMLFGCSSAQLRHQGNGFEPRGVIQEYILANCPCVIGCLWMVTDKDIDRLCIAVLKAWLSLNWQWPQINKTKPKSTEVPGFTKNLLVALSRARKMCKLPYLTGAACVAYGLPVLSK